MSIKVLFVAPFEGNGGIVSWASNYRKKIPPEVELVSVGVSRRRALRKKENIINIILDGFGDLKDVINDVRRVLKRESNISLLHLTTSGGWGSIRDLIVAKYAKKHGVKCILHCHYGCIPQDYHKTGLKGFVLRWALREYNQIWVLDKYSFQTLNNVSELSNKIEIVPNPIDISAPISDDAKNYFKIGYVGNLIPSKGIFELTSAVKACSNTTLDIIGPGNQTVINRIKSIAGEDYGKRIVCYGQVNNTDAVKMMNSIDILALPTYFSSEAFPISILEAMSLTKMVISCPRAAIPDILMSDNGEMCGILVEPKSSAAIEAAIVWCQTHPLEADIMCQNAYRKVYKSYRTEVVINSCIQNYLKLL